MEKNVGQICYQRARLMGSIISVCFGQGLVISYMLFLALKDDDTLLHEAGMVMEKKISLKTWKKRWNNRNSRQLFFPAAPPSWHYLLILGWCFFVLIRQITLLQSTHCYCQDIKDERKTLCLLQFGQESESSPGISSRKILSRAL